MQLLLQAGADVNTTDGAGWTPLLYATRNDENPEVVKLLLDKGANVDAATGSAGSTALQLAAKYGRAAVVSLLLARGADTKVSHPKKGAPGFSRGVLFFGMTGLFVPCLVAFPASG